MFCRNSIFHNTLQLHLDSIFREPRPPSAVPASLRRELSATLAGCEARPHGAGFWFSITSLRKRVTPHTQKKLGRDFASNPSRRFSPPVIFASGTRAEPGPSNGLSNVRAPPSGVARKALRRGQAGPGPGEHLGLRRSGRRVELCEDSRAVQV